jgi:hypothetical protein
VVLLTANDFSEAYYAFDGTESYVRVQIQLGKIYCGNNRFLSFKKKEL